MTRFLDMGFVLHQELIFLKGGLINDIQNYIPMCEMRKYKNINAQIHKLTNTAYMPKCQKDIFSDAPACLALKIIGD